MVCISKAYGRCYIDGEEKTDAEAIASSQEKIACLGLGGGRQDVHQEKCLGAEKKWSLPGAACLVLKLLNKSQCIPTHALHVPSENQSKS